MKWLKIEETDFYSVSDAGDVRNNKTNRILKPILTHKGHHRYNLYARGGKRPKINRTAHALVMTAFCGPRPDGFSIEHIDGNKEHNNRTNLRYSTAMEIYRHRRLSGRVKVGSQCEFARLSEGIVGVIDDMLILNFSAIEIGYIIGIDRKMVNNISRRRSWAHVPCKRSAW